MVSPNKNFVHSKPINVKVNSGSTKVSVTQPVAIEPQHSNIINNQKYSENHDLRIVYSMKKKIIEHTLITIQNY